MALLSAILLPSFLRSRAPGQLTACKSNLKNIGTALEMYSTDFAGKYPRNIDQLRPNYLKTIPECPAADRTTYRVSFGRNAPGNANPGYADYFFIECVGGNHENASVTGDYPVFQSMPAIHERAP